jgi:hypothetical protein
MREMASASEPDFSASVDTRPMFRLSAGAVFVFAIGLALVMAACWVYLQRSQHPWVEIVGKDLLRTTAPSKTIASAREAVIRKHQNWIEVENGKRSDPTYQGGGRSWSSGPTKDIVRVKVTRGKTQITDKNAATLSIEIITVTDTPTLIFIHHDNPDAKQGIVSDLFNELLDKGVQLRH